MITRPAGSATSSSGEPLHGGAGRVGWALVGATLAVVAGTLVLYQPWRRLPFDIIDFSEFLPLLHRSTIAERLHGFLTYYASQGRWNVLSYVALVAKWSAFGTYAAGWELTRFVELWLIIVLVFLVLRRFGADAWGAAAGAALFTVATPAVPAWSRLTMGEPMGLVFLAIALLLATGYRTTGHWRRGGVAIAVLVALAVLAKEMLVVFVPFILVVSWCQVAPDRLAWPQRTRRNVWLIAVVGIATLMVLVPVAITAHNAPPGNYASQYGGWKMDPEQLSLNFATVMLPVTQSRPGEILSLFTALPNALYLVTLAMAAVIVWCNRTRHRIAWGQILAWTALALSLPVFVVVAYGPWSYFQDFYGLPYVIGPAMLLAGAVTAATRFEPRLALPMRALCMGILVFAAVRAFLPAQESIARRQVQGEVAAYLAHNATRGPVLVMKSDVQTSQWARWQDTGPTLGRYAMAMYPEAGLRPFLDTTCTVPPHPYVVNGHSGTVVTYASDCGTYPHPTATFRAVYHALTIHPPAIKRDTIRIDICDSACTR